MTQSPLRSGCRAVVLGIVVLVAACGGDTRAPTRSAADGGRLSVTTAPSASASIAPAVPPVATPPLPADPRSVALAEARGRWERRAAPTFAYTVNYWNSSGFGAYTVRVTSLEDAIRVQAVQGDPGPGAALAPEALFDLAGRFLSAPGTAEIAYDDTSGLPVKIHASGPPGTIDADTNLDVLDIVFGPTPDRPKVRQAVAWALSDWSRAQPATFSYTWTRVMAVDHEPASSFEAVREPGGAAAFSPELTATGAPASTVASVPATLHDATAALASGAWVDLTTQVGNGVPLLLAVDPSPALGDAYWIQIAFRDIEHEQARIACEAARDRWASAALTRYRYVWHYSGDAGTYTYAVAMRGEVATLTRVKGSAILRQSIEVGPRLDVLFDTIERQLASGGRVVARYDPIYGYPRTLTLTSVGEPSGTITISEFALR